MSVERKDYATDDGFFDALLADECAFAKKSREQARYNKDDVKPRVTLIGPNFQLARPPLVWESTEEKYRMMHVAGLLAKVTGAKGLMLMSDSRWLRSDDFCHHFKLPVPATEDGAKVFSEQYNRILAQYGGEMCNLPRHLWSEAMMICLKTPTAVHGKSLPYTRGTGTRVMWLPELTAKGEFTTFVSNLVPDWWTISNDDPGMVRMRVVAAGILKMTEVQA